MEVKPGYKQTEVGVIPEQWRAVRIGDLFTFKNGLNKAKQFFGHGTPIVNYMDVFGRPGLRMQAISGRVDVSPKELNAYEVRRGDVFFTRTSETVEEIGIAAVMLDQPEKTVYSGFVLRARPIDESLDDMFKAYCFSPRYFRQQVTARASYTTRALTNGRSLSASLLARPPLPEQRAIAAALSDVDALLGGLDRLIAKKRDLKQAAMQQLLTGQTRLPGFSGAWEVKTLGDIVEKIVGGGTPSRANAAFWGNEIPWVTVKDFATFNPWHSQESITRLGLRNSASNLIPAGTLITSTRMALGKAVVYEVDVAINQDLKALFLKPEASVVLLTYWFEHFGNLIDELGSGSTVKGISIGELRRFPFQAPPLPEQTAIAAVLSDMDAELAALEARRDKTRDLKQAMMQELLTGKTRLL